MSQPISRRGILSLFVAAGAGAAVAACSSNSDNSKGPQASDGSPIPTAVSGDLTIWNFSSQLTNAINDKYIPSQPNLKVTLATLGQADEFQRLLVALASGSGVPGVATLSSRTADRYLKTGGLEPYSDAELAPFKDGLDSSALITYKGKVYGVPLLDGRLAMWVNNATLEKYQIDADTITTFDALAEAGRKLKQDSGGKSHLFMVPQGTNGADFFSALAASAGQNWFKSDGTLIEDQSIALSTLTYVVGLVKDGVAQVTDWTQPGFYDLLKQQQLTGFGMNYAIGASNLPKNVPDQSGQWRMVNWPAWGSGKRQTVSYGETFFAVLSKGGNPAASKNFATWWLTADGLPSTVTAFGTVPYKPAHVLPAMQQASDYFGGQKVLSDLMSVPMVNPNYLNWSGVEKVVSFAVDQAVLGKMTPEQAIDRCVSGLKAL